MVKNNGAVGGIRTHVLGFEGQSLNQLDGLPHGIDKICEHILSVYKKFIHLLQIINSQLLDFSWRMK